MSVHKLRNKWFLFDNYFLIKYFLLMHIIEKTCCFKLRNLIWQTCFAKTNLAQTFCVYFHPINLYLKF